MANVTYEIQGGDKLKRILRDISDFYPDKADPVFRRHAVSEARRLRGKPYPAMLPNQVYQRTGQLGSSFKALHKGKGVHGVRNRRDNAVWVIWKGMQNRTYHLGRWWTFQDEIEDNLPKLEKALADRAEVVLSANA